MDDMKQDIPVICFVVKNVILDNIQKFMQAWLKQSCKDFKIVFIARNLDDKQRLAVDFALKFAKNLSCEDNVMVVESENLIPQSRQMVALNSTNILPVDDNEVLAFKTGKDLVKLPSSSTPEKKSSQKPVQVKTQKISQQKLDAMKKPEVKKLKIACYTCITSNYDALCPIKHPSDDIDFICFTDDLTTRSSGWKIRMIPSELLGLSKVKQQRILKICPQTYLSEYDVSLWVDANFVINGDLSKSFFPKYDLKKFSLYTNKHPLRDCIYDEEAECIKRKKDLQKNTSAQMSKYRKEGMPKHFGLAETGLMLRNHHDNACKAVMELWKNEVLNGSHRDQLSFNYACWKLNFRYGHLAEGNYREFSASHNFALLVHQPRPNTGKTLPCKMTQKTGIVIINYNTNALVNALIQSINRHVKKTAYDIVVMDNSTTEKFQCPKDVILLDNSQKQLIDFDKIIMQTSVVRSLNNYASYKHALTIQFIMDTLQYENLVFMDSDVLLKRDIDFIDSRYAVIADFPGNSAKPRFLPFIMYVNQKYMRSKKIKYLDVNRMHGASNARNSMVYDTGCSFYEDVMNANLPVRHVNFDDYIVHLGGGSWKKTPNSQQIFLNSNMQLWRQT